ncbi:MAG TPA: tetratricopeptide repeat protein [Hanamia sp.]|nr:tetratricopeptide repeat protein [Hanamia sp.]
MKNRVIKLLLLLLVSFFFLPEVHAQLGKITFDLQKDKPQKFKDKPLRSEKPQDKKLRLIGRFVQNTTSHYNYFFNANNKINAVIEMARMANKDDYSQLLPYYSYSLDNTAQQKILLDSVILESTAGILLHDLRTNWVDNFYLLIGEAYYLRKDFDSASMTFQFINYNLYPRKKKDEDQMIVGSNDNNNALSISSKEDRNLIDKAFSRPPSRNDALVWQIRALTDMGDYGSAAGLINTLRDDPQFPERLESYFQEVQGYWFFKQKIYDSAISYIQNAMSNALDLQDQARREYLLAQLYERSNKPDTATNYYDLAIRHTTDPLMDIYANLNEAIMLKSNDPAEIDKSIARLLRMAHKDRFEPYRDIIYYSAGEIAMLKPDTTSAMSFYKASTVYNENNLSLKNKAFLNLAEINYNLKKYKEAYNFYDSLQAGDTTLKNFADIELRKNALAKIVNNLNVIDREDSLQMVAAMPEAERDNFLKKLSKKLMKERGIKEDQQNFNSSAAFFNKQNMSQDFYGNNTNKGDWYFYNNSVKAQGYNEFKRIWGKRQNVDNWRLSSISTNSSVANNGNQPGGNFGDPMAPQSANETVAEAPVQQDISVEGLRANLPLTQTRLDTSNSKVARSLFAVGKDYQNLLEDYHAAIDAYEKSLKRFPDSLYGGELYMNLSFCYNKIGNQQKADYYKDLLVKNYNGGKYALMITHPEAFNPSAKDTAAQRRYDKIYNLFIEGNFDEAIKEKNEADSLYGQSYWNPQLLYIQSVYYIKNREDSAAKTVLQQIINKYPNSPMKEKATTMLDVLGRRDSIERYLTNLNVTRAKADSQIVVFDNSKPVNQVQAPVTQTEKPKVENQKVVAGKAELNPEKKLAPPVKKAGFEFDPLDSQNVVMVLTKVDPVYSSEARNAFNRFNSQSYATNKIQIIKDTLDSERTLLVFSQFQDADEALKYLDKLKQAAPTQISWLPAQKYTFYIISDSNLQLLKENKNLQGYIDLLKNKYPAKF